MTDPAHDVPRIVGVGAIFIDDIVLPDGTTYMAQLGGGVVHALMGAAIWDERPGIVALTGHDLSPAIQQRLKATFDTQGLHHLDIPQIRAWQIFETDGTRRELYRTAITQPFTQGAQPQHLPPAYRHSQGYYLLQDFEGIQHWYEAVSGTILWEPLQQVMQPGSRAKLRHCLRTGAITIISPNLAEARTVYETSEPADLVNLLLDDGAQIVVLRMGANGSLVADQVEQYHIPTVPVKQIVDQTGAGNTYCGAFLVGCIRGKTLQEAGAMGAVAASYCLQQVGSLDPAQVAKPERDTLFNNLVNLRDSSTR